MRYYYKDVNGNKCSLKTPVQQKDHFIEDGTEIIYNEFTNEDEEVPKYKRVDFYTEITEEEFNTRPVVPQEVLERQEKRKLIDEKQKRLDLVKWKIEQVDLFHEERADIDALREEARTLHHELEDLKNGRTASQVEQNEQI